MNLSNCIKKLSAIWLLSGLLFTLPDQVSAQKLVRGEINVDVYSFVHAESFPCNSGFGDIMSVEIELLGDLSGTSTIDFKAWIDTPTNQHSDALMIEYPTEITTLNGQYYVDYLGRGAAGELNFRITAEALKDFEESLDYENDNLSCQGIATIVLVDLFAPDEEPVEMVSNCLVYYDVWLTNVYCVGLAFDYTIAGNGSLAENGDCFQEIENSRLASTAVSVMPNPFYGNLEVQLFKGARELVLTDANGRQVYSQSVDSVSRVEIATENLPAGIYFLCIMSENEVEVQKLIKAT